VRFFAFANVSSETNPDAGRVPTARNWAQLVGTKTCGCYVRVWDELKRAYKIDGFVEPLPGTLG